MESSARPNYMRATASLIAALAVAVIAVTLLVGVLAVRDARLGSRSKPSMSVTGEGSATAKPDTALYRVSFSGQGATTLLAVDQANQRVRRLAREMRSAGLKADDVSSSGVRSVKSGSGKRPWKATASVVITVKKIGDSDDVLRALRKLPVVSLSGPEYSFSDENDLRERAVADAIRSARRKVQDAARQADMDVDGVRTIEEKEVGINSPGFNRVDDGYGQGWIQASGGGNFSASDSEITVARNSGEFIATARVRATFNLDD